MALLEFGEGSNELLWMAEAISKGSVQQGALLEIVSITKTSSGNGFLIECVCKDQFVFDFAWKKGKTGQTLAAIFDDPTLADGNALQCKAQTSVKNAVLSAKEVKGVKWELSTYEGKDKLTKKTGSKPEIVPTTTVKSA